MSVGREQTVYIGSTVELSCNLAPGTSAARVQWSRDRGFLPPTAFKKRDNKLQLVNVQPEDAGRYQCEVTTAQGVASEYVLLKIDSKQWPESATVGLAAAAAAPPLQRLQQRWVVGARHRDAAASSQSVESRRRSPSARTY